MIRRLVEIPIRHHTIPEGIVIATTIIITIRRRSCLYMVWVMRMITMVRSSLTTFMITAIPTRGPVRTMTQLPPQMRMVVTVAMMFVVVVAVVVVVLQMGRSGCYHHQHYYHSIGIRPWIRKMWQRGRFEFYRYPHCR